MIINAGISEVIVKADNDLGYKVINVKDWIENDELLERKDNLLGRRQKWQSQLLQQLEDQMYGKSTFFNYIVGQKISIVEDKPGVTRDRVYADTEWRGRKFTLIDTAGIEPKSEDEILISMREQVQIAIDIADVIVFLTDIKQGITEVDKDIALLLKKTKKPVVLVCNKSDNFGKENNDIYEFYNLGIRRPACCFIC